MSEDASPAVLEVHLPRIREIIINLLQGLKLKQAEYKQYLLQQRASSSGSRESLSGASGHRSSRLGASSRTERLAASDGGAPSGTELTDSEATQPNAPNRASSAAAIRRTGSGRSTASVASQSGGVRRAESGHSQPTSVEVEATTEQSLSASERGGPGRAPLPQPPARENGSESERAVEVPQKRSIGRRGTGSNGTSALGRSPLGEGSPLSLAAETDASSNERPSAPAQRLPDAVQRHSLVDGPVPRSEGGEEVVQEVTTPPTNGDESQETVSGPPEVSISSPSGRVRGSGRGAPDAVEADPSLRALKSRDALERRASKRFSAYTFNKMGVGQSFGQGFGSGSLGMGMGMLALNNGSGTPTVERRGTAGGAPAPEKRSSGSRRAAKATSERPTSDDSRSGVSQGRGDYFSSGSRGKGRALPSSSSGAIEEEARTPSTNAGTPGAQEEEPSNRRSGSTRPARSPRAEVATLARPALNTHHTASSTESLPFVDAPSGAPPIQLSEDESEQFVPPVPPLPTPAERARLDAMQERGSNVRSPGPSPSSLSTPLPTVTSSNTVVGSSGAVQMALFLQLGRQTRKAVLDLDPTAPGRGVSVGRLRMLFIDRFAYSPGMDDFPAIYLKDPGTGVAFELEDLGDVQEGCLLTLNIERESVVSMMVRESSC